MKKIYLLLIIFCFFIQTKSKAQNYFDFPDSNAIWHVDFGGFQCSCCASYHYTFEGDTLINAINYHKIHKFGISYQEDIIGNCTNIPDGGIINKYAGAIRSDQLLKQTWIVPKDSADEFLLYDFNLVAGDTVNSWLARLSSIMLGGSGDTIIVSSVDSVLVGTQYRRRWNFDVGLFQVIEGIGSTGGTFNELLNPFEFGGFLNCFQQDGQTLYPDTSTVCQFAAVPENHTANYHVHIYPNPANDVFKIEFTQSDKITFRLFNSFGQEVIRKDMHGTDYLDVKQFANGIYFWSAEINNRLYANGKIAVNH